MNSAWQDCLRAGDGDDSKSCHCFEADVLGVEGPAAGVVWLNRILESCFTCSEKLDTHPARRL